MVDVKTDILIAGNLPDVFSYTADPDNAPDWYQNISSVEWEPEKIL